MANLNTEQARAVNHINGPCLVLAGPGSGKTFTLVERIRHLIEDIHISPSQILVITFSKKASNEMRNRFDSLTEGRGYPVYFGTFHAMFYSIVKAYYGYGKENIITENGKKSILKRTLKKIGKSLEDDDYIESIISKVSMYKTVLPFEEKRLNFLNEQFVNKEEAEAFSEIFSMYSKSLTLEHKLDFDDMLYMCLDILTNNHEILKKYRNIYKYFLVDEFQDINDVQYEVLKLLAGENRNVFAVGDDDQSIYGFRGSNPELMQRFINDNSDITIIDMHRNYRCPECVINSASRLISLNNNRINKIQSACKPDKDEGTVNIISFDNASLEAQFVCDKLLEMKKKGIALSNAVILYRTTRCVGLLEEKLDTAGIKYSKKSEAVSFYKYEWVKDIISYIKLAAGGRDESLFLRIINKPDRNILREDAVSVFKGEKAMTCENTIIKDLISNISLISSMKPFAAVAYIMKALKYESYMNTMLKAKGYSDVQINLIKNEIYERAKMFTTINLWLDHIRCFENTSDDSCIEKKSENIALKREDIDCVNLMTVHASKGLEYNTVFVIGLQEGVFPSNKSFSEEQIEEERRLMYVAMTRAKKDLYIVGRGEEKYGKRVSRFISEISNKAVHNEIGK